ncbi:hypothetical protein B0T25DRAFT_526474 [Lasiosphaeria hispida]|uniref:Uncharacterized protein n=1 Tax=Lasiosphaeria hispida TaxID=260671 RepID=A0AAJ0HUI5_9PEZI|nr:hypothetical protein B0T25DRAFT_526474 [Lasiosphaeria hispida]
MTPPNDSQLLPQRLDKIMATLHSRLVSDVEVQDYHFLVDPVDHHHLAHNSFPHLKQLKEAFPHATINLHFNPTTGKMTVTTLHGRLLLELWHLLLNKLRHCIAAHPQTADTVRAEGILDENFESEVPHCLVALYQSRRVGPSLTISAATIGNKKRAAKSTLAHVMTNHPGLQTMVRLDFGGLTMDKPISEEHHERRVQRIAYLSSVLIWTRDRHGSITSTYKSLSRADGEFRLCLLSGNSGGSSSLGKVGACYEWAHAMQTR